MNKFEKGQVWLYDKDEIHLIINREECGMVTCRNVCLISIKRFWYELGGIRGEQELESIIGKSRLLGNSLGEFYSNIPTLLTDPDPQIRETIEFFVNHIS